MTTVVVTGAAGGIGEATVQRLHSAGHRVVALVRRIDSAAHLVALASERCIVRQVDVTIADDVARIGAEIDVLCREKGLLGLVSCAGVSTIGPVETTTPAELRRTFEVNTIGAVAMAQACLPALRRGRGRIVNVGSIGGRVATPLLGGYGASKFALDAITTALRHELRPAGITVSLVEPGVIDTPMTTRGTALIDACRVALPTDLAVYYGPQLDRGAKTYRRATARPTAPDRVAKAIEHALVARRPRLRYPVGADARIVGLLHWLLPERVLEWLVRNV
jgi:NAD(P)-dependent dehydrogenase (short-subunit alcohol dehydrogenase family)